MKRRVFTANQYAPSSADMGLTQNKLEDGSTVTTNYGLNRAHPRKQKIKSRTISGPLAGLSDRDIKRQGLAERLAIHERSPDSRYYNTDGSQKTPSQVQAGFAKLDSDRAAGSEKNRLQQFARFSDFITRASPDKDGFVTLDEDTAGRLPSIAKGFTGINNPKELKVRMENGFLRLYGNGQPLDVMNIRKDVLQESSRIGSVINQQGLNTIINGNVKDSGKLNDKQKAAIKTARESLSRQDSILDELKLEGVSPSDKQVVAAMANKLRATKDLRQLTSFGSGRVKGKNYDFSGLSNTQQQPTVNDAPPQVPKPNGGSNVKGGNLTEMTEQQRREADITKEGEGQPSGLRERDRPWYNLDITQHEVDDRPYIGVGDALNSLGKYVARQRLALPR